MTLVRESRALEPEHVAQLRIAAVEREGEMRRRAAGLAGPELVPFQQHYALSLPRERIRYVAPRDSAPDHAHVDLEMPA